MAEPLQWILITLALVAAGVILFRSFWRQLKVPEEGPPCGHESCAGCALAEQGNCPGCGLPSSPNKLEQ